MITYTILQTRFNVNPDGTQGKIYLVTWYATMLDGSVVGTIGPRGTPIPADYAPADKVYADVTEQDCIDWVTDLEDQTSIEAQLQEVIDKLENPTQGTGKPWQSAYPLWAINVAYAVDDIVVYENIGYQVIQAHTSQSIWAPPETPALWKLYVPPSEGPQPWVQPLGSEDAYPRDAQVTHQPAAFTEVHLWTSLVEANVWEPTPANSTLWLDEGVYP